MSVWAIIPQFVDLLDIPVPEGSIHLLSMKAGANEYVYVLSGTIETGGKICTQGTFWYTSANTKQGIHKALTDVEIMTIRLGKMGVFEA